MNNNEDWKNWWHQNAWAPTGLVRKKFNVTEGQIKSYRSKHRNEFNRLKLKRDQKPKDRKEALEKAWKYYIEKEEGIDLDSVDASEQIRKIKNDRLEKQYDFIRGFLKNHDNSYLRWMKKYRGTISFLVHNIYPGKEYCEQHALFPERFPWSRFGVEKKRIIEIVAKYYLYDQKRQENRNRDEAKKLFITRWREADFLSGKDLISEYGINDYDINRIGVKKIKEEVANKFRRESPELSSSSTDAPQWNGEKFKENHPDIDWSKCRYCGATPTDLHHLIPRAEAPELTDNIENVVPLCLQTHGFITRRMWSKEIEEEYKDAMRAWKKAPKGRKKETFDLVMNKIHDLVRPKQ